MGIKTYYYFESKNGKKYMITPTRNLLLFCFKNLTLPQVEKLFSQKKITYWELCTTPVLKFSHHSSIGSNHYGMMGRICFGTSTDSWGYSDYKVKVDPYGSNYGLYCSIKVIYKVMNSMSYFWVNHTRISECYVKCFSKDSVIDCFPATLIMKYLLDMSCTVHKEKKYEYWLHDAKSDVIVKFFKFVVNEFKDTMWFRRIIFIKLGAVGVQICNELRMGSWSIPHIDDFRGLIDRYMYVPA